MKRSSILFGLLLCSLVAANAVQAADPLAGSWGFSTAGTASLDTATNGNCKANGTQPAAIFDSFMDFSNGTITIHKLGILIGATTCTSLNFQGTGTYTVEDKGKGGFEATGTLTPTFVGRAAACSGTVLTNLAFTIIGKMSDSTATITINGLESGTYAEGPPPGPLSCTTPILNLTGAGTGKKM
jgi:hypothetical protein